MPPERAEGYRLEVTIETPRFGQVLRAMRDLTGVKQIEFGNALGFSPSSYNRIEQGTKPFPIEKLPELVGILARYFPEPEEIRNTLEDVFVREAQVGKLVTQIPDLILSNFTDEQITALRENLRQPVNRDRFTAFLKQLLTPEA